MFDELTVEEMRGRVGLKWGTVDAHVIPAWVADMDFPPAPAIAATLRAATSLGYPAWLDDLEKNPVVTEFVRRMRTRHGFATDPSRVRIFTDVIQSLEAVLHVGTSPGDAVAMHVPAYPPFLQVLAAANRPLVPIPLVATDESGWSFDPERFEADVERRGVKALILVNPQNPTGRSFRRDELTTLAEIAERHDLLVIADEIHADLTYAPHTHTAFGTLGPEAAARTVTLTSATKAFNIAGMRCAVAHVGDRRVYEGLQAMPPFFWGDVNRLGVDATVAAWRDSDDWLAQVLAVLDRNRRLVVEGLPAGVRCHLPEATYLAWLDFRDAGLGADPGAALLESASVRLAPGVHFGPGGEGFARLNFATSKPILDEMLARLRSAIEQAG